jgi:DNA-binding MarR family transcriptional regulator
LEKQVKLEYMNMVLKKNLNNNQIAPINNIKINADNSHDIWVLLDRTHFAVTRSRLLELAQFNLTKEQAQVLYVLRFFGGSATMTQIASFTLRQHHSVSTLVKRMEKTGLLKKTKVHKNKVYKIIITKKGKDIYEKVTRESIEMVFSSLSSEDKRKLTSCLIQLQERANSLLGLDYQPPFLKRTAADLP